jgi:hypothetical protein
MLSQITTRETERMRMKMEWEGLLKSREFPAATFKYIVKYPDASMH